MKSLPTSCSAKATVLGFAENWPGCPSGTWAFALLGFLLAGSTAAAQIPLEFVRAQQLLKLSGQLHERWVQEQAEAAAWAALQGYSSTRLVQPDGRVDLLVGFRGGLPIVYATLNRTAADTVSTDELWNDSCYSGTSGLGLTGLNVHMHIWDEAQVRVTHQEFDGRAAWVDGGAPGLSSHATHVAGTMVGQGQVCSAHGMASMATLDSYDFFDDEAEIAAAAAMGSRVSNHSYGIVTGWEFGDFGAGVGWYWFGDLSVSTTEDVDFGRYTSVARGWDDILYNAPKHLMVHAAGNDRGQFFGGSHFVFSGGNWVVSSDPRDADGGAAGYDCIGHGGNAKNTLTVGNARDIVGGYSVPADVLIWTTSSWGPVDDGRIKPDIVANGVGLTSADSGSNSDYGSKTGTSMATPNVSGSLGALLEHYRNTHPFGEGTAKPLAPTGSQASSSSAVGGCCLDTNPTCDCLNGLTAGVCSGLGGTFLGDGVPCEAGPCDCDDDGICDSVQIAGGALDCDEDGLLDVCTPTGPPCDPQAATWKALAIHTADEAGTDPGPDYRFGWGLLNALAAADQITLDVTAPWAIQELVIQQGETIEQTWPYTGVGPFKATIAWTDPPGSIPPLTLDNPTKVLVNDLDLRIIGPDSTEHLPWRLDVTDPTAAATKGDNNADNVEVVIIDAPLSGEHTIRITHTGTLTDGQQAFSLILTGAQSPGCGSCQLHGDIAPSAGNCVIDVDDILEVLAGFGDPINHPGADLFSCGGNGAIDVDDVLSSLRSFAGEFDCPHPCSPGACCLGGVSCEDRDQGMTLSNCIAAGGVYQGDGVLCEDVTCP